MTEQSTGGRIPERELLVYAATLKSDAFHELRHALNEKKKAGFTQKRLAERIGMDEGFLSRKLKGEDDLQLETLAVLARGMDYKFEVKLVPLSHPEFIQRAPRTFVDLGKMDIRGFKAEQTVTTNLIFLCYEHNSSSTTYDMVTTFPRNFVQASSSSHSFRLDFATT